MRSDTDAQSLRPAGLPETVRWHGGENGHLTVLDQTRLPGDIRHLTCETVEQVWEAIKSLRVRGAPLIGVTAAYGLCVGTRPHRTQPRDAFIGHVRHVAEYLDSARPTAVNLSWALRRLRVRAEALDGTSPHIWSALLEEAHAIQREDADVCRRIGEHGAALVPDGGGVLTHCNAGALATAGYGTALAALHVAHQQGRRFKVFADETRPLLQGARLTAFELAYVGIDTTVLCDGAAAALLASGQVQMAVVGADRIAVNGDTANKIGTLSVALAAAAHEIPFYVAAPLSTFDPSASNGAAIPIEHRAADEIRRVGADEHIAGGVACYNPAFDVTPARLIRAIITEHGIIEPVNESRIAEFLKHRARRPHA